MTDRHQSPPPADAHSDEHPAPQSYNPTKHAALRHGNRFNFGLEARRKTSRQKKDAETTITIKFSRPEQKSGQNGGKHKRNETPTGPTAKMVKHFVTLITTVAISVILTYFFPHHPAANAHYGLETYQQLAPIVGQSSDHGVRGYIDAAGYQEGLTT